MKLKEIIGKLLSNKKINNEGIFSNIFFSEKSSISFLYNKTTKVNGIENELQNLNELIFRGISRYPIISK